MGAKITITLKCRVCGKEAQAKRGEYENGEAELTLPEGWAIWNGPCCSDLCWAKLELREAEEKVKKLAAKEGE